MSADKAARLAPTRGKRLPVTLGDSGISEDVRAALLVSHEAPEWVIASILHYQQNIAKAVAAEKGGRSEWAANYRVTASRCLARVAAWHFASE